MYDALNVLMAMNIITKEKKEIMWKGPAGDERERRGASSGGEASGA